MAMIVNGKVHYNFVGLLYVLTVPFLFGCIAGWIGIDYIYGLIFGFILPLTPMLWYIIKHIPTIIMDIIRLPWTIYQLIKMYI
jgi:hypothetical protein